MQSTATWMTGYLHEQSALLQAYTCYVFFAHTIALRDLEEIQKFLNIL